MYSWKTDELYPNGAFEAPKSEINFDFFTPSYESSGFLGIQHAIASSFIKQTKGIEPDIEMKMFPHAPYTSYHQWVFILPMFIFFSFNYTFVNTIRFISIEKEKQLKEFMQMHGVKRSLLWMSWLTRAIFMLTFTFICIIALLQVS